MNGQEALITIDAIRSIMRDEGLLVDGDNWSDVLTNLAGIINDWEGKQVMRKFEQVNENDRILTITSERRAYIYECAMHNEGPDGTFSDEECLLWEMFRHAYEYGKGERDGIW